MINTAFSLLIVVFRFFSVESYQELICPDLCQPCLKEAVICQNPGRANLPEKISSTVERLTITNQKFLYTTLSSDNFTQFAPPHISLKLLFIRHTNVKKIESRAFSALTKLESLDLSNNYNLTISNDAFNGLKIRHLIINNIHHLILERDVFRGLDVTSLSLANSGITSIDYDTLHPLSKSLSKLFLYKNHIKSLEPKLDLIFQNLDSLDLTENNLDCDCNIKWLIKFYNSRVNEPTFNENKFQIPDHLVPKCKTPNHLKGQYLTQITENEIVCESPKIFELDLKLNSLSNARLVCSGEQVAWRAPLQISWYNTSLANEQLNSEVFINKTKSVKSVSIKYLTEMGYYKCVVNNSVGEASAVVRINWPDITKNVANNNQYEEEGVSNSRESNPKARTWRTVFFERRFTLLEIIAAVTGTILFTGLLFILIHRFVMMRCVFVKKKNAGKLSRQSNLATLSLTTSYEPAVYSNSQTYDTPGAGYAGSNLYLPAAASSSQQFLDFKTQRKIYRKL